MASEPSSRPEERPVDEIEDRIWHAVVTLYPSPALIDVLQQLARDATLLTVHAKA